MSVSEPRRRSTGTFEVERTTGSHEVLDRLFVYGTLRQGQTARSLIASLLDSAWGLAAGSARDWFVTSPRRLSWVGGTGGLTLIGLGAALAVTGRRD